jgi:imidazolonepropionase-like amidohydrolase
LVEIICTLPAEAINATTIEAAKCQRFRDLGSLEVSKRTDLVFLGSNPLLDITNTRDIERLWVKGI